MNSEEIHSNWKTKDQRQKTKDKKMPVKDIAGDNANN